MTVGEWSRRNGGGGGSMEQGVCWRYNTGVNKIVCCHQNIRRDMIAPLHRGWRGWGEVLLPPLYTYTHIYIYSCIHIYVYVIKSCWYRFALHIFLLGGGRAGRKARGRTIWKRDSFLSQIWSKFGLVLNSVLLCCEVGVWPWRIHLNIQMQANM